MLTAFQRQRQPDTRRHYIPLWPSNGYVTKPQEVEDGPFQQGCYCAHWYCQEALLCCLSHTHLLPINERHHQQSALHIQQWVSPHQATVCRRGTQIDRLGLNTECQPIQRALI